MNAYDNNAHVHALSDNELDAVSGGERHEVTKEQYDTLLMVRMVVAGTYKPGNGTDSKW
jgi:hypothetical protein